jgi:hypothetical protein
MNPTKEKDIYNFLVNSDFINYVINPDRILKKTWESFFNTNPDQISVAEEAKRVLLGESILQKPSSDEVSEMKYFILNNIFIS